jgi:hypothetical protein
MLNTIEIHTAKTKPKSNRYDIVFYVDGAWEIGCFDGKQFMSMHGRFYFERNDINSNIFTKLATAPHLYFYRYMDGTTPSNCIRFRNYLSTNINDLFSPENSAYIDTWYHIAFVASATHKYIYINGSLSNSVEHTIGNLGAGYLIIGRASIANNFTNSDSRCFNNALTET